jgi:hypothetical protein
MPKRLSEFLVQDPFVMNENTVNKFVADYLIICGFEKVKPLLNKERGIDVSGRKDEYMVLVESKGSQGNDHERDKVFDNNQLWDHLCKQIGKLMQYRKSYDVNNCVFIAANPNIPRIKVQMDKLAQSLDELRIFRFWVDEDGSVSI